MNNKSEDCKQRLDIAFNAARKYLPSLSRDQLYLDYSGIRPKLAGPGNNSNIATEVSIALTVTTLQENHFETSS